MTEDLFTPIGIDGAVSALEKDLTAPGGPSISTMRNHNFAILLYKPEKEFQVRARIRQMTGRLESEGWAVLSIALHQLVLQRLRREEGDEGLQRLVERERRLFNKPHGQEKALNDLKERMSSLIDGENGLAADVAKHIADFRARNPDVPGDKLLVLMARAGALYPFFRSSALLKHLGGRTQNLPVVLLYPGVRKDGGLSFMEELAPDRDYRPRIYA